MENRCAVLAYNRKLLFRVLYFILKNMLIYQIEVIFGLVVI